MFIHWGVYSLLGQGEWVMQNRPIAVPDYEWLATTFNPAKFDARTWVSLAKAAGMKYITITSRHHDGFAMFGTRATRYNIVDWTPFHRDPLKSWPTSASGRESSSSSITHSSTGIILTTGRAARRASARAGPMAATGTAISTFWTHS